jgi:hypothetical protein
MRNPIEIYGSPIGRALKQNDALPDRASIIPIHHHHGKVRGIVLGDVDFLRRAECAEGFAMAPGFTADEESVSVHARSGVLFP